MIKQLFKPENGWKRYDDTNDEFLYSNQFERVTSFGYYNNTFMKAVTDDLNNAPSITFYALTDKIRIISDIYEYSNRATNIAFYIDGKEYRINLHSSILIRNAVIFEKLNLENKMHKFELKLDNKSIKPSGYKDIMLTFDAIDISNEGYLSTSIPCVIKSNNEYYSFAKNHYNVETQSYDRINVEDITIDSTDLFNSPENLLKEITIGDETFKPIDKFSNDITLVSKVNFTVTVETEPTKEILVQSSDFDIKNLDNFTFSAKGTNVKLMVSVDNGNLLYYDINAVGWTNTNMTIENMQSDKDMFKSLFTRLGMDISYLSKVDFVSLKKLGNKIKFVILLIDSTSNIQSIDCTSIDASSEILLKDTEMEITKFSNRLEIVSNSDMDKLVVNIIPHKTTSSPSGGGSSSEDEDLTDEEIEDMLNGIFR